MTMLGDVDGVVDVLDLPEDDSETKGCEDV
jgi:hypothetical protein